jgi:HK97 family phage prohead protease
VWNSPHQLSPQVAEILDRYEREVEQRQQAGQQAALRKLELPRVTTGFRIYRRGGIETLDTGKRALRMIRGIASTATINDNKRSLDPRGCKVQFPIPLRCEHKAGQIGEVVVVTKDAKRIIIEAMLWDTPAAVYAWKLIQSGAIRALSAGSTSIRKTQVTNVVFFEKWLLREVSVCRTPANPNCVLEVLNEH